MPFGAWKNTVGFGVLKKPASTASFVSPSFQSSGYRFAIVLVVADITGGDTLAIQIQDSADNSIFATVSDLGTVSGDPGEIKRAILVDFQQVRRYVRLTMQGTGSPPASAAVIYLDPLSTRATTSFDALLVQD
jgi:hypothetical protein